MKDNCRIKELQERIRKICYCCYTHSDIDEYSEHREIICPFDELLQAAKELARVNAKSAINTLVQIASDIASSPCYDFDIVLGLSCIAEAMAIIDIDSGAKIIKILNEIIYLISRVGLAYICEEALVRITRVMIKLYERGFKAVENILEQLLSSILKISNYCEFDPEILFNVCRLLTQTEIQEGYQLFSCLDTCFWDDLMIFMSSLKKIGTKVSIVSK